MRWPRGLMAGGDNGVGGGGKSVGKPGQLSSILEARSYLESWIRGASRALARLMLIARIVLSRWRALWTAATGGFPGAGGRIRYLPASWSVTRASLPI
jgi:hypothetical protein